MNSGECRQSTGPDGGEDQAHHAPVVCVGAALDEPEPHTAVDQPDGAVGPDEQVLGDVTNGRPAPVGMPAPGQEQLVLGSGEPCAGGLALAPSKEATQTVAQLQEPFVLIVVECRHRPTS